MLYKLHDVFYRSLLFLFVRNILNFNHDERAGPLSEVETIDQAQMSDASGIYTMNMYNL